MHLTEAGGEDARGGGVVAEPVRTRVVRLIAVYPYHEVVVVQDLREGNTGPASKAVTKGWWECREWTKKSLQEELM